MYIGKIIAYVGFGTIINLRPLLGFLQWWGEVFYCIFSWGGGYNI